VVITLAVIVVETLALGLAAWSSGSAALFALTAQSVAGLVVEGLLLVGSLRSGRPADDRHPLGYGRGVLLVAVRGAGHLPRRRSPRAGRGLAHAGGGATAGRVRHRVPRPRRRSYRQRLVASCGRRSGWPQPNPQLCRRAAPYLRPHRRHGGARQRHFSRRHRVRAARPDPAPGNRRTRLRRPGQRRHRCPPHRGRGRSVGAGA
jgi:Cation efflux family